MRRIIIAATLFIAVMATALALVLSAPTQAGPLEDGLAAYYREDYTVAERLLRPLAEQGNAPAQIGLGFMYHYGKVVPQD